MGMTARLYANLVRLGRIELESVPDAWRDEVAEILGE